QEADRREARSDGGRRRADRARRNRRLRVRRQVPFPAVHVDRVLHDGDTVKLAGTTMTAVLTAGHSKGCTTWTMTIEGKHVVFVCSTTAPGYRLEGPIVDEFRETFRRLEAMPCDVFLAAHGSFFDLDEKRRSGN